MKNHAKVITPLYDLKRKLEAEIVILQGKTEVEKRNFLEAAAASTGAHETLTKLNDSIEEVMSAGEEALQNLHKIVENAEVALEVSRKTVTTAVEILNKVNILADGRLKEVSQALDTARTRLKQINLENDAIDAKKVDLDIYQKRLQKKYDELGLGKLIV